MDATKMTRTPAYRSAAVLAALTIVPLLAVLADDDKDRQEDSFERNDQCEVREGCGVETGCPGGEDIPSYPNAEKAK